MTKNADIHKVNVKVKGDLKHLSYKLHALIRATLLGLETTKLVKLKPGHIEMEFTGERSKLWKIVKWAKGGSFLSKVDEVTFAFTVRNIKDIS